MSANSDPFNHDAVIVKLEDFARAARDFNRYLDRIAESGAVPEQSNDQSELRACQRDSEQFRRGVARLITAVHLARINNEPSWANPESHDQI